jgi:hypothetical protein
MPLTITARLKILAALGNRYNYTLHYFGNDTMRNK